eukprot:3385226-Rhodomonas_salina.1
MQPHSVMVLTRQSGVCVFRMRRWSGDSSRLWSTRPPSQTLSPSSAASKTATRCSPRLCLDLSFHL